MQNINTSTTDINDYTVTDIVMIKEAALQHARDAGEAHLKQYGEHAYLSLIHISEPTRPY